MSVLVTNVDIGRLYDIARSVCALDVELDRYQIHDRLPDIATVRRWAETAARARMLLSDLLGELDPDEDAA